MGGRVDGRGRCLASVHRSVQLRHGVEDEIEIPDRGDADMRRRGHLYG